MVRNRNILVSVSLPLRKNKRKAWKSRRINTSLYLKEVAKSKDKSSHPVLSWRNVGAIQVLSPSVVFTHGYLPSVSLDFILLDLQGALYPGMLLICTLTAALAKFLPCLPYCAVPHGQNCCGSQVNFPCACSMPWNSISGMFRRTRKWHQPPPGK